MKKILLIIGVLITLLATGLTAQNADQYSGSLLWKISGNGLDKPSYILGTHHLKSVSFVDSIAGLRNTLDEVEQVAGEVVMSDMAAMQVKMQQAGMMPADESYKTLLDETDYNKLDKGLTTMLGAGLEQLGRLNPGMLSTLYVITLYAKLNPELNMMKHEAIDQYVQKYAAEKNKSIIGLETIEDQIYVLFEAEPLKDQAAILTCTVSHPDFAKETLLNLNKYYTEGNINAMYALGLKNPNDPCPTSEKTMFALNKDRNNKWINKLPQIMEDKSTLVAVGALHLGGEEGLLNQLALKGYTVEKMK